MSVEDITNVVYMSICPERHKELIRKEKFYDYILDKIFFNGDKCNRCCDFLVSHESGNGWCDLFSYSEYLSGRYLSNGMLDFTRCPECMNYFN